jgi:hypothetical protein
MLELKSPIYYDRPTLIMGSELCGYDRITPLMHYGPPLRKKHVE